MSMPRVPSPKEDNLNYQAALETLAEASEAVIQSLGVSAVQEAERATYYSGVSGPSFAVKQAETITHETGVNEPRRVIAEANAIKAYGAEVATQAEELSDGEQEDLSGEGISELEEMLSQESLKQRYASFLDPTRAKEYELRKAKTSQEVDEINKRYSQEPYRSGPHNED